MELNSALDIISAISGQRSVDLCTPGNDDADAGARPGGAEASWDPGNIDSDQVFYNTVSMSV